MGLAMSADEPAALMADRAIAHPPSGLPSEICKGNASIRVENHAFLLQADALDISHRTPRRALADFACCIDHAMPGNRAAGI